MMNKFCSFNERDLEAASRLRLHNREMVMREGFGGAVNRRFREKQVILQEGLPGQRTRLNRLTRDGNFPAVRLGFAIAVFFCSHHLSLPWLRAARALHRASTRSSSPAASLGSRRLNSRAKHTKWLNTELRWPWRSRQTVSRKWHQ